jgi:hypothetical protein
LCLVFRWRETTSWKWNYFYSITLFHKNGWNNGKFMDTLTCMYVVISVSVQSYRVNLYGYTIIRGKYRQVSSKIINLVWAKYLRVLGTDYIYFREGEMGLCFTQFSQKKYTCQMLLSSKTKKSFQKWFF